MTLFIDTHDSLITIGLKVGKEIFIKTKESEYSHSIYTIPMIEEIINENNVNIKDVKKIIVINGPGSFTGIRIGLSIAKTMAYSLNCLIFTLSSLKAYLISNTEKKDKMCVIEDNKGCYICAMDKDNNIILEEEYVNENEYKYNVIENKLDVNRIIDYMEDKEPENVHHIKANYVKKIEVEK